MDEWIEGREKGISRSYRYMTGVISPRRAAGSVALFLNYYFNVPPSTFQYVNKKLWKSDRHVMRQPLRSEREDPPMLVGVAADTQARRGRNAKMAPSV